MWVTSLTLFPLYCRIENSLDIPNRVVCEIESYRSLLEIMKRRNNLWYREVNGMTILKRTMLKLDTVPAWAVDWPGFGYDPLWALVTNVMNLRVTRASQVGAFLILFTRWALNRAAGLHVWRTLTSRSVLASSPWRAHPHTERFRHDMTGHRDVLGACSIDHYGHVQWHWCHLLHCFTVSVAPAAGP
jgi:hypothetical protein